MNRIKVYQSPGYNCFFDMETGVSMKFGDTIEENPTMSPDGPEIMDIEVSTVCSRGCSHCYKSNGSNGRNMDLGTYRRILEILPQTVNQIAFGIGDIRANPDLIDIFKITRDRSIIPNVTINGEGMDSTIYSDLNAVCGAVGVSLYDIDTCMGVVKEFNRIMGSGTMRQINVQALVARQTIERIRSFIDELHRSKLRANLVFLMLKHKGRGKAYTHPEFAEFRDLVQYAMDKRMKIGFDACSASVVEQIFRNSPNYESFMTCIEPCEGSLFSYYVNVDGKGFPCSFVEGEQGYVGVDLLQAKDFKEVWNHPETIRFRKSLLDQGIPVHKCPIYTLIEQESERSKE